MDFIRILTSLLSFSPILFHSKQRPRLSPTLRPPHLRRQERHDLLRAQWRRPRFRFHLDRQRPTPLFKKLELWIWFRLELIFFFICFVFVFVFLFLWGKRESFVFFCLYGCWENKRKWGEWEVNTIPFGRSVTFRIRGIIFLLRCWFSSTKQSLMFGFD